MGSAAPVLVWTRPHGALPSAGRRLPSREAVPLPNFSRLDIWTVCCWTPPLLPSPCPCQRPLVAESPLLAWLCRRTPHRCQSRVATPCLHERLPFQVQQWSWSVKIPRRPPLANFMQAGHHRLTRRPPWMRWRRTHSYGNTPWDWTTTSSTLAWIPSGTSWRMGLQMTWTRRFTVVSAWRRQHRTRTWIPPCMGAPEPRRTVQQGRPCQLPPSLWWARSPTDHRSVDLPAASLAAAVAAVDVFPQRPNRSTSTRGSRRQCRGVSASKR
mmetsp:Transcript_864/g.2791  ORF Transcript_864/g.2791 Transcript_864/m.2791 type:complete len:268 (-) Transcript_864:2123-2926(-)